jgi:hypothetical protein
MFQLDPPRYDPRNLRPPTYNQSAALHPDRQREIERILDPQAGSESRGRSSTAYTLEEILEHAPERMRSAGASFEGKGTKRIKKVKNVAKKILKGIWKVVNYAPGTENVQLYQGQGSQEQRNRRETI